MLKRTLKVSLLSAVIGVLAFVGFGRAQDSVQITPSTLNVAQYASSLVTVHVDTPYVASDVVTMSNGAELIEATYTFADDCGDLVAKFALADVLSIAPLVEGEVTLYDLTITAGDYMGSDTLTILFQEGVRTTQTE